MKTNAVVLIVSAGVGAALVGVGACSSMMGNKTKKVVIEDGRIFIPGTAISKADQDSVMAILRQYKRSLYKIQTYKDGNPSGKAHGTLPDEDHRCGNGCAGCERCETKRSFRMGNPNRPSIASLRLSPAPTPQPSGSPSHPTTVQPAVPSGSPSHPTTMATLPSQSLASYDYGR